MANSSFTWNREDELAFLFLFLVVSFALFYIMKAYWIACGVAFANAELQGSGTRIFGWERKAEKKGFSNLSNGSTYRWESVPL
ncbi:hypothetical protein PspKH34_34490 [Parageobacillus sp. KH3-4]|jgi:hypothetical protein|uniref:Uncharacterized protein n=1 Tax=Parageobacillus thermoglucosidasius TaxID=1426 RepID=A0A1B7KMS1_PARTM|nr:hypothetical protein A7K69_14890 [Parageobacillus thermoglucosidasius]BDG48888.1 hypothetical protein PspKH34_34490 [Parageobacillus sp. KH3-4]